MKSAVVLLPGLNRDRDMIAALTKISGKAIEGALGTLDFDGVNSVRQGKVFDLEIDGTDKASAESDQKAMCDKLLANTVIENYNVAIL